MGHVRVRSTDVTIPSETSPGDYNVGVIYDSATDGDSGNNDTDGWDAGRVQVGGPRRAPPIWSWNRRR